MDKTFQTRIKHKRDSQANWETNNPVLLEGELGIVVMSDGKIKTKVGDGVTNYNLLPFSSSDVELTWENIENRPFGEMPGDTLTWDGNTEGLVSAIDGKAYKVSDATPTAEESVGGVINVHVTDVGDVAAEITSDNIMDLGSGILMLSDLVVVVPESGVGVDLSGFAFNEPGVYFAKEEEIESISLTIPGYTGFSSIKKIDPKYLPPLTKEQIPEGYPWNDRTVIEWDGNTEGKIVIGGQFYKVSNKTPTIEDVGTDFEMTATSIVNEEGQTVELSVTNTITEIASGVFAIGNNAFVCPNDAVGVDIMGLVFEEAGIYFNCPEVGLYVSSLTYGTATPISETLLPDSVVIASDEAIEVPVVDPYVRHDREQTLTEEEKALARLNIGAASASEVISDVQEQLDSKVPNTRTVNGKALSANISLSATDIGAAAIETTTATIAASAWSSNSATISNNLITASNTIIIAPAPTSYVTWGECKIRAVTQTAGKITFQCDSVPTASVTVNLVILG